MEGNSSMPEPQSNENQYCNQKRLQPNGTKPLKRFIKGMIVSDLSEHFIYRDKITWWTKTLLTLSMAGRLQPTWIGFTPINEQVSLAVLMSIVTNEILKGFNKKNK